MPPMSLPHMPLPSCKHPCKQQSAEYTVFLEALSCLHFRSTLQYHVLHALCEGHLPQLHAPSASKSHPQLPVSLADLPDGWQAICKADALQNIADLILHSLSQNPALRDERSIISNMLHANSSWPCHPQLYVCLAALPVS